MIRINLAKSIAIEMSGPEAETGDAASIQRQGALRLLVIMLFPVGLYVYELQLIPDLQGQLASKQKVLESLKSKNEQAKGAVEEIRKFKEDQAKLQKQIDTLEGLRRERLREVKIMDNLQKDIPEKVWLTKVDFQEKRLSLSGLAVADTELTTFMDTLSKSVFLHDVSLVRSVEQPTDKGVLKKFEISTSLDDPTSNSPEVKK